MAQPQYKEEKNWLKLSALIVSAAFHPLLMPVYILGIAFFKIQGFIFLEPTALRQVLILVFLFTFAAPVVGILFFYKVGVSKTLMLSNRSDRPLPMVFCALVYGVFYYALRRYLHISTMLEITILAMAVAVFITGLISFFWKISAHGVGVGGGLGFLYLWPLFFPSHHQLLYPLLCFSCLSGLTLSARLYLQVHTPGQIWAGAGLGIMVSATTLILYYLIATAA